MVQQVLEGLQTSRLILYLTPIRMAAIKEQEITSVGEHVEKLQSLCVASGNVKWCSRCGKQSGGASKI